MSHLTTFKIISRYIKEKKILHMNHFDIVIIFLFIFLIFIFITIMRKARVFPFLYFMS